jgi:branched-chain amino acid transport system substrate-binding protein
VSEPLTGPDEDGGLEDRDAVITAVERWKSANGVQIEGHDIVVRAEDDGCTEADIAVQAAERLLRQPGLVGVIGPGCSAGAAAAIPVYAKAGIVAISGSATSTGLTEEQPEGGLFFRTAYRNDLEGLLIAVALTEPDDPALNRVLLVDDGETYGQDLADTATKLLEESGVPVVRESIERGAVDYSEIAAEIANDNPDIVGFAGFNPEAALFYEQLRDAGYEGEFGATDAAASVENFIQPVGADKAEGVAFVGCALELPDDFLDDFSAVHGEEPAASAFVAQAADAATILLDAVAQVAQAEDGGSLAIDPGELRDAVAGAHLADGLSGSVAFDSDGDRVPAPGDELEAVVAEAVAAQNGAIFPTLGLVPCVVHNGRLVNSIPGQ